MAVRRSERKPVPNRTFSNSVPSPVKPSKVAKNAESRPDQSGDYDVVSRALCKCQTPSLVLCHFSGYPSDKDEWLSISQMSLEAIAAIPEVSCARVLPVCPHRLKVGKRGGVGVPSGSVVVPRAASRPVSAVPVFSGVIQRQAKQLLSTIDRSPSPLAKKKPPVPIFPPSPPPFPPSPHSRIPFGPFFFPYIPFHFSLFSRFPYPKSSLSVSRLFLFVYLLFPVFFYSLLQSKEFLKLFHYLSME